MDELVCASRFSYTRLCTDVCVGMMYIAKHRDDDEMGNVILDGFLNLWPLFLAVIVLTGYMAIVLWLSVSARMHSVDGFPADLFIARPHAAFETLLASERQTCPR